MLAFSIPMDMLMTPAESSMDSQLPTSDSLNDGQIIEMVTSSSQSSQADSDEDEEGEEESISVEEERISSSTVVNAIYTLMRYFEQCQLHCTGMNTCPRVSLGLILALPPLSHHPRLSPKL